MPNRIDIFKQLRLAMMDFAKSAPDDQAYKYPSLFPSWEAGVSYVNTDTEVSRVEYNGKLYKCIQGHTSQIGWEPSTTPALWVEVAKPGEYREIKANMLPTEAFDENEIGWWKTKDNLYKSKLANNVYTPESYPDGWEKVSK